MSNIVKKFPIHPAKPERICWGCDQFCAADSMHCGNGSDRTPHPIELFGDDWLEWGDNHDNPTTEQMVAPPVSAAGAPDQLKR